MLRPLGKAPSRGSLDAALIRSILLSQSDFGASRSTALTQFKIYRKKLETMSEKYLGTLVELDTKGAKLLSEELNRASGGRWIQQIDLINLVDGRQKLGFSTGSKTTGTISLY